MSAMSAQQWYEVWRWRVLHLTTFSIAEEAELALLNLNKDLKLNKLFIRHNNERQAAFLAIHC